MPKVIQRNLKKKLYIIYSIISIVVLPVLLLSSAFADTTVTYEVQVEPSLNISFSSDNVSLDLNPLNKTFDTQDLLVTVSTNNSNGYKLYVNTDNDTTNLINTDYSDAYIETLGSTVTESTFDTNKWGFRITGDPEDSSITGDTSITSTTSFFPFAPGSLISSSSTATNASSATLTFASKINYQKPSGTYTLDLNFKALPLITTLTMQEIKDNPSVCTTDPTLVVDSRDGQTYAIARLADGKCWMVQNLKLGKLQDNIILTSADSNVDSNGFTLSSNEAGAAGRFPGTPRADGGTTSYVKDKSEFYCTNDYGCYYNWYTATAGSGKGGYGDGETDQATGADVDVNYSICPSGWGLPTNGELYSFATSYGYEGADTDIMTLLEKILVSSPTTTTDNINGESAPGLLLPGAGSTGGMVNVGKSGSLVSSTSSSIGKTYITAYHYYNQIFYPDNSGNKCDGRPVRCLLQETNS